MKRTVLAFSLLLAVQAHGALSKADLHAWLEEAVAAAARVPAENRREIAYALELNGRSTEQVKACLFKLALRPSSPAWWDLLWATESADHPLVLEFLEAEYRARAGVESEERRAWHQGLAEMLFTTGRYADGLELQRSGVAAGNASAYGIDLLAIMEKVAGDADAYARVAADPPQPAASERQSAEAYLQTIIRSVTHRMRAANPKKIPPQLAELLGTAPDWRTRIANVITLSTAEPARGEAELRKIIADPAAPADIRDDATYALAHVLSFTSGRAAEEVVLIECWLARRGIVIPAATETTWTRLRELPAPEKRSFVPSRTKECFTHHGHAVNDADCLLPTASLLMYAASAAHDYEALRRGIGWMAAQAVEEGRGLENVTLFLYLASSQAKSREERVQILQYLGTLPTRDLLDPVDDENEIIAAGRRQATRSVNAPWTKAVAAPAPACP